MAWSVPSTPTKQYLFEDAIWEVLEFFSGDNTTEEQFLCYAYSQGYTHVILTNVYYPLIFDFNTNKFTSDFKSSLNAFIQTAVNNYGINVGIEFTGPAVLNGIVDYNNTNSNKVTLALCNIKWWDYSYNQPWPKPVNFDGSFGKENTLSFVDTLNLISSYKPLLGSSVSLVLYTANLTNKISGYAYPNDDGTYNVNGFPILDEQVTYVTIYGYTSNFLNGQQFEAGDIIGIVNDPVSSPVRFYVIDYAVGNSIGLFDSFGNAYLPGGITNGVTTISSGYGIADASISNAFVINGNKTARFTGLTLANGTSAAPIAEYSRISVTNSTGNNGIYTVTSVSFDSTVGLNGQTTITISGTHPSSVSDGLLNPDVVGYANESTYTPQPAPELYLIAGFIDEFLVEEPATAPLPNYNYLKPIFQAIATAGVTTKVGVVLNVNGNYFSDFFQGNNNFGVPTFQPKNVRDAYKYITDSAYSAAPPSIAPYANQETNAGVIARLTFNSIAIDNRSLIKPLTTGNGTNIYTQPAGISNINITTGYPGSTNLQLTICDDCLPIPSVNSITYKWKINWQVTTAPIGSTAYITGVPDQYINNCPTTPQAFVRTFNYDLPGVYIVTATVSDPLNNGQVTKQVNYKVTVTGSSLILNATISQTGPLCYGSCLTTLYGTYTGSAGNVSLDIYNSLGALVASVPNATITPGTWGASGVPLCVGTYSLVFTDTLNSANTYTATYTVTTKPQILVTTTVTNVLCNGGTTGSLEIKNPINGTAPYTLLVQKGASTICSGSFGTCGIINSLAAGTYTITVTDSLGCSAVSTNVIEQPKLPLEVHPEVTLLSCPGSKNATINLDPSSPAGLLLGGTPPYTYTWSGITPTPPNTQFYVTGLGTGTYSCLVKDANGCSINTGSIVISGIAAMNFTISGPSDVCYNPSIKGVYSIAYVSGGNSPFTYSWDVDPASGVAQTGTTASYNFTNTFNPTFIGCTVTDSNGCSAYFYKNITQNTLNNFVANITGPNAITQCVGSTLTLQVTNSGGTGNWNNLPTNSTSTTLNITNPKNYFATYGTTATVDIIAATGNGTAITYTTSTNHGYVNGQTVAVTGLTPLNFNTTGAVTVISPTQFSLPSSATHAATSVLGAVGSTTYYDFTWTEKDATGACQVTSNPVRVFAPPPITLTATVTPVPCNSPSPNVGAITTTILTGCAPFTYSWTRDGAVGVIATTQNLTAQVSDMYHVTITDANSNTVTYDIKIGVSSPEINLTQQINTCGGLNNGSLDVTISGGTAPYTYSWINTQTGATYTTQDLVKLYNGSYTLTVTDSYGCTDTETYVIRDSDLIVVDYTVTPPSCPGVCDGAVVWNSTTGGSGAGNYTYAWSDNPNITTPSRNKLCANGTYQLIVTDGNGCNYIQSISVPPSSPAITITSTVVDPNPNTGTLGSITITSVNGGGGPPYTYEWKDSKGNTIPCTKGPTSCTGTLTGLTSGTYYVTISGPSNACPQTFSFTLVARCDLFSITELKLQLYKFQCCAGKLADKYVQYQNIGRPELAECLLVDLKYLTLALDSLTCITDLPDPCLSCDDIANILDQMKKICDCDCCLDAGDHTYQVSYNYNTGVFTPLLPAIN